MQSQYNDYITLSSVVVKINFFFHLFHFDFKCDININMCAIKILVDRLVDYLNLHPKQIYLYFYTFFFYNLVHKLLFGGKMLLSLIYIFLLKINYYLYLNKITKRINHI